MDHEPDTLDKTALPEELFQLRANRALTRQEIDAIFPKRKPQPNVKEWSEQANRELAVKVLREEHEYAAQFLDEHIPARRLVCCYRMVRELARIRGDIHDDETMADVLMPRLDPFDQTGRPDDELRRDLWKNPVLFYPPAMSSYSRPPAADAVGMLMEANNIPADECLLPGMSLLPPPVPESMHGSYDPDKDRRLLLYINILDAISRSLSIRVGSGRDRSLGELGMRGLNNPTLIRYLFPTPLQLISYEVMVIDRTLDYMVKNPGDPKAMSWLYHKHGFTAGEARVIVRLAKSRARVVLETDLEDERAMMQLRLQDIARRAQQGLDLRAELAALKQLSIVQGLSKNDNNDIMAEFSDVVRAVSSRQQKALPGGPGTGPNEDE